MEKAEEYEQEIKKMDSNALLNLWKEHAETEFDESFWKKGKVLEYVVLRAFEIEILEREKQEQKGSVTYPYNVFAPQDSAYVKPLEQIDGAVHVDELYALVECKDYSGVKINIEPLAKMRNQLARRHSSVFGMFFSATDYTVPAEILVGYMAPQLIVLWTKMDIEFCLKNSCFIPCMKEKYRRAVENCEYNYAFYLEHTEFERLPSEPLF